MKTVVVTTVILLLLSGPTWAQPTWAPQTVVAQTSWSYPETITLLVDACDARTMRAQWVTRDRTVIWGCWGYNPTGVQVVWSTGRTEFVDWFVLWYYHNGQLQQMGYQTLHKRVAQLRSYR
jgi:hypothetical protein